jgi:L-fuconolactonase
MLIVDPHVHVYKTAPAFPWPAETAKPPEEDRTAEMLLELMDANGVAKTVLVQVIYYRWDNSYVAHVIKQYPDRFMAVGRINPEDPAAPDHLSMWKEEHGIHGQRLSPGAGPEGDWCKGPLMEPIFARAEHHGIPMLLLTQASRLKDMTPLFERHPDMDIVIDHMASVHPEDSESREILMSLARFPRVYVKISHTWSMSKESFPWQDTFGLVEEVYQNYGAQRIMWGTDWPVCLSKAEYPQALEVVRDHMKFIASQDLEWVLGKTVLRVWPFDGAAQ